MVVSGVIWQPCVNFRYVSQAQIWGWLWILKWNTKWYWRQWLCLRWSH